MWNTLATKVMYSSYKHPNRSTRKLNYNNKRNIMPVSHIQQQTSKRYGHETPTLKIPWYTVLEYDQILASSGVGALDKPQVGRWVGIRPLSPENSPRSYSSRPRRTTHSQRQPSAGDGDPDQSPSLWRQSSKTQWPRQLLGCQTTPTQETGYCSDTQSRFSQWIFKTT